MQSSCSDWKIFIQKNFLIFLFWISLTGMWILTIFSTIHLGRILSNLKIFQVLLLSINLSLWFLQCVSSILEKFYLLEVNPLTKYHAQINLFIEFCYLSLNHPWFHHTRISKVIFENEVFYLALKASSTYTSCVPSKYLHGNLTLILFSLMIHILDHFLLKIYA